MHTSLRSHTARGVAAVIALAAATPAHSQAVTTYYEGTSQIELPGGRTVPGGTVLAKRTVDKGAGTIVEQVISADSRPGKAATEYLVTMRVNGATFTMSEASGAFDGDGTLQGTPWQWNTWTSTSKLKDGTRVESTDSASATSLTVHKRIVLANGTEQLKTAEQFKVIDAARFAARRSELIPK